MTQQEIQTIVAELKKQSVAIEDIPTATDPAEFKTLPCIARSGEVKQLPTSALRFKYTDFTQEQIQELKQPATQIAEAFRQSTYNNGYLTIQL